MVLKMLKFAIEGRNQLISVNLNKRLLDRGVVSHIAKFGDASKSPARDAASLSGDAVVSHRRCIISFRDAHPPHLHPHLP